MKLTEKTMDKIKGAMMGVAVGDALGATLEFLGKNEGLKTYGWLTEIIGGGFMGLKAGEVTDDTDMTIAVANGILDNPKNPIEFIGQRFMDWYYTDPKDMGISCKTTFNIYNKMPNRTKDWEKASKLSHVQNNKKSAGNGTLMRCVPVALYYRNDRKMMEKISIEQSKLTHFDDLASCACIVYNNMLVDFLEGAKSKSLTFKKNNTLPELEKVLKMRYEDLNPSGFVIDTLICALYAFLNTCSFDECVCMAINLCGDADTIGAIAGGLAGAYYGYKNIPERLSSKIILKNEILDLAGRLAEGK